MEAFKPANPFPGARAFRVRETGSTMDDARALALEGFPPGSLVMADTQTRGRGRFPDRNWMGADGESLLFTMVAPPAWAFLPAFPLRVGLALARAVESFYPASGEGERLLPRPLVKWPNDLMLADGKAGGILIEASAGLLLVGIGVNCSQETFPSAITGKASSLRSALGLSPDRLALLEAILRELAATMESSDWKAGVEERLWRRGLLARMDPGLPGSGKAYEGVLAGLDGSGAIVIEGKDGPRSFIAGELSFLKAEH